jgi:SAM-dependent methyltransferase
MRARALAVLRRAVPPGSRVIDLGCGPGTDAQALADAGYRVTAVDWSPSMVSEARQRVARAGLAGRVTVERLGIHELDQLPAGRFDAAWSDFGPLNCVPDLPAAARLIAGRLRPGGVLAASVIGRIVPWELALFAAKRDWSRARVRFARGFVAVPLDGGQVWMRYFRPAEFEQPFRRAGFERLSLRALGVLAPPPYLEAFARRHPRLVRALMRLEDAVAGWPGIRGCGDHFLIVLRRRT